jgi:predicted transcriptional regulator
VTAYPPPLHELETEVMEELWRRGEGTVREVLNALNGRGKSQRAYTTILTVMQRLHAKDLLRRERRGRHDAYVPVLTRDEYAQARSGAEFGALVREYGDVALAQAPRADPAPRPW